MKNNDVNKTQNCLSKHLKDEEIYELSDFFKILGDSTRLKILWALDRHEMTVTEISTLLGMTKSAVSHQLKTLKDNKLVNYRKQGKNAIYELDDLHISTIIETAQIHLKEEK